MNQEGPELRDIHLPADPPWWPPAPGWWLLVALLVVASVWLWRVFRRRQRKQRWHVSVQSELARIAEANAKQPDAAKLSAELSALLRRASLLIAPHAAALNGDVWLRFLDAQIEGDAFSNGPGRALLEAPFQRDPKVDADALIALTSTWLTRALAQRSSHA